MKIPELAALRQAGRSANLPRAKVLALAVVLLSTLFVSHHTLGYYNLSSNQALPCHCEDTGLQNAGTPTFTLEGVEDKASALSEYWNIRKNSPFYVLIADLAREHAPSALTVLDVGAYESPFLARFDWIPTKVATDIQSRPQVWQQMKGIAFVQGDFLALQFGTTFDLVMCTQVIEHVPRPAEFIAKMASIANVLIVSTTLDMPKGTIEGHINDPINETTFRSWFPVETGTLTWLMQQGEVSLTDPADGKRKLVKNQVGIWKRNAPI